MSRAFWAFPSGISGRACLRILHAAGATLFLGLLLGGGLLFLLVEASASVGTEPGDVSLVAAELVDDPAMSVAPDKATEGPIARAFDEYLIDDGSERRLLHRLLLLRLRGRGPPF
jgi:hypothetical protein